MVGVFSHLVREVHFGASEVSHFRPFLPCFLVEVGKSLLYPDQVVGSVVALARCLLLLSDVGLGFDEVGLEGHPVFVLLHPSRLKIFRVLSGFCEKFICDAYVLGFCDWITHCFCEVGALIESLNETFKWIFRIVSGAYILVVCQHVRVGDVGDHPEGCLWGVSCVHVLLSCVHII